jgi:hypothetical protein
MDNYYRHCTSLSYIIQDAIKVSSEWNGDEAGRKEDKAHLAEEIVTAAEELRTLLEELENM